MPTTPNRVSTFGMALALTMASSGIAPAQGLACADRDRVLTLVIDTLGQARMASGTMSEGARIDLFASESGAWTLILHLPDGRACLLGHGQNFEATAGLPPARGTPT